MGVKNDDFDSFATIAGEHLNLRDHRGIADNASGAGSS
jgi:hypothetical protein